ncbi:MAG: LysM peptidoglycan-binding domain-containing protein [Desulfuromonadales bacterium]|nr:LysM peptidoglycan-binding domain-containing protein [Desulfuromonadales bacterium]NIS42753.1 LysM peptidoglycan-binding domain-containing protein [Desulfuromonadales bacterium]
MNREGESRKADLVLKQAIFFARRASETSQAAWGAADRQAAEGEPEAARTAAGERLREKVPAAKVESVPKTESAAKPKVEPQSLPESPRPEKAAPAVPRTKTKAGSDPPLPREYVVRDGETLWSIAARRIIYRDALLWPLIYRANRDQIKDPRQIFPQQVLTIPRNVSDEEREEAREKARRSEIFPVEVLLRQIVEDGN